MAAYAAAIPLKNLIGFIKKFYDVFLPASLMEIIELADREMKSFLGFVERLDSRSRKRMSASLERCAEAILKFNGVFESHFDKHMSNINFIDDDGDGDGDIDDGDLKRDAELMVEALKKTKEEEYSYCYPDDDDDDDDDDDSPSPGNKMIGLRDQFNQLKEQILFGGSFTSIVGMVGIGKTTLAWEIFNDLDIVELFDCRVWVTVDEEFYNKEFLESILAQVDPPVYEMAKGGDERTLFECLEKSLENKLTLIVLHDVWETHVVDFMAYSFPTTESVRILFTTTNQKIVEYPRHSAHELISMRLMNKQESWDLLRVKVFGEESCPPQLEDAGKKIAEKCDGLPLTIITVADLLSKAGKTKESLWIDLATRKRHQLFTEAYDEISEVLYPIYQKTQELLWIDKLESNFLYLGVFLKNYEIPRSQLTNLWIAEGILNTYFSRTPEIAAVKCIKDLTSSSLVMVYQRSSRSVAPDKQHRRAKTCALHSSWWHFCQREARENKFFHVLGCPEDSSEESIKGHNRLSVHNNVLFARKDVYNSIEKNCASTAQSLLCFGPYHQYEVPICVGLKLLQRLDALNIRFYEFPLEVLELVELTYLALTCNGKLPPSISKLLHLQFLTIHQCLSIKSQVAPTYLPIEIWDIKHLQHLQVMGNDLPSVGNAFSQLERLLGVSAESCTKGVFERVPSLNKLGIRIELRDDVAEPLRCFDHISLLENLDSLKCVVVNPKCRAEVVAPPAPLSSFPSNLIKLSLSGLGYLWEEMTRITPLPNLEVLKLRCNAFEGPMWEVEKGGFPRLRFLLIEDIDLVQLKGGRQSFLHLECLRIKHCYKLEKLDLAHCESLSDIDVVDSNPLVEKEVKEIAVKIGEAPKHFSLQFSWKL